MATVNIRSDVSDSFYRYKMPRIQSKVEGKGNGIKTVIPNMSAIGKSLSRPPTYSTKFFGCELGAQVKFDIKNDRYIVNGAHDASKLAELLDLFIKKFVLCSSCQNPETDLIVTKDQFIVLDCKACGARSDADMRHKLVAFIIKNPPVSKSGSGGKKDRKGKKNKGDDANGNGSPADGNSQMNSGDEDEGDDEITRRINAEAADLPNAANSDDHDDEDWSVDTSADAVARRMKDLAVDVSKMTGEEDDEEAGGSKYELFGEWLTEHMDASNTDIYAKAEEMEVSDKHKALQVIAQVVFTENVMKEIPKRVELLTKFGTTEKHQRSLLGGIERLVGINHRSLLPKISLILKSLYDADVLDEEVILKWGAKPSRKYVDKETSKEVRKKAEAFLSWLETAEDEDSEDDEDED